MSINYVIATWAGQNGSMCRKTLTDVYPHPKDYLRVHLEQLAIVAHNITQVTIMMAHVADGIPMYQDYYKNLEPHINTLNQKGVIVEFVPCPNFGLSYGQYFEAYERFKNQFDYYCFIEDDYTIGLPHFDEELKKIYHAKFPSDIGYLCSWAPKHLKNVKFHAANSNGLISSKTLEKLYDKFKNPKKEFAGLIHGRVQLRFSDLFLLNNIPIADFSDAYAVPHYKGVQKTVVNCAKSPKSFQCLFIPVQIVNDYSENVIRNLSLHCWAK